jgi:hypothetical protein
VGTGDRTIRWDIVAGWVVCAVLNFAVWGVLAWLVTGWLG